MKSISGERGAGGAGRLEDIPVPDTRNGPVLAEICATGACATDVGVACGRHAWTPLGERRLAICHESVVRVRDTGTSNGLAQSDNVARIVRFPDPVPNANCDVCGRDSFCCESYERVRPGEYWRQGGHCRNPERLRGQYSGVSQELGEWRCYPKVQEDSAAHVGGCAEEQPGDWSRHCQQASRLDVGGSLGVFGSLMAVPHHQSGTVEEVFASPGSEFGRHNNGYSVLRLGSCRGMKQHSYWRQVLSDFTDWALIVVIGIVLAIVIDTSIAHERVNMSSSFPRPSTREVHVLHILL